jgi:hemophore-related protein
MMKLNGSTMRRRAAGCGLLAGLAVITVAVPTAWAAPDCSSAGVNNTVGAVTGSATQYLSNHPGANAVVTAAKNEPRPQAATDLRNYFTAHPQEYVELRDILAPIGDTQRQCNTTVLSPDLQSAYDEFMAG